MYGLSIRKTYSHPLRVIFYSISKYILTRSLLASEQTKDDSFLTARVVPGTAPSHPLLLLLLLRSPDPIDLLWLDEGSSFTEFLKIMSKQLRLGSN